MKEVQEKMLARGIAEEDIAKYDLAEWIGGFEDEEENVKNVVEKIRAGLLKKEGYCPCRLLKTEEKAVFACRIQIKVRGKAMRKRLTRINAAIPHQPLDHLCVDRTCRVIHIHTVQLRETRVVNAYRFGGYAKYCFHTQASSIAKCSTALPPERDVSLPPKRSVAHAPSGSSTVRSSAPSFFT